MKLKTLICTSTVLLTFSVQAASPVPTRGKHGMVVSTSELASRVGVDVLKKGGNAVDASVAVGLALAVTWPSGGNIGGGGFMLIRKSNGKSEVIDYRERAPLAATRNMYLDSQGNVVPELSTVGYKAIAVPGTVAGFALAHSRYGKLKWADVVEPARQLADKGFIANYHFANSIAQVEKLLAQFPESKRIFLKNGKGPVAEGELFRQPDLAATLSRIKTHGAKDFYEGETARRLIADIKSGGGVITSEDLKQYKPTLREPIVTRYRNYEILTMPPPSSGGAVLAQMLGILEVKKQYEFSFASADSLHLLVETMKRSFADRAEHMGDADFVSVPLKWLTSQVYISQRAESISSKKATPSQDIFFGEPPRGESEETTHYAVADAEGNVVSNTYTLNGSFGNGVVAKGTGVLLNNEMDDFTSKPGVPNMYGLMQNEKNAITPKKRPLSSMTPTVIVKNGKFFMAVGSPGGPTIINTVLQVTLNVLDHGMTIQEAIDAPRFHHQWMPDKVRWEKFGLPNETKFALAARGHVFDEKPSQLGDAQGIVWDEDAKLYLGASDPRLGGRPAGY